MSPGQWVARALVAGLPAGAALLTAFVGNAPPVGFVVALLVVGLAWAAFPESAAGVVVLTLVIGWWGIGLRDGLDPWALPAAALLLVAHVAAVVVSYGPPELPLDSATVALWVRRAAVVLLAAPVVYGVALVTRDVPEPPGMWVLGLAAAFVASLVSSLLLSRYAEVSES